jgi:small subunit ribosomal protein S3
MAVERKFVKEAVNRLLVKDFVQQETQRAGYGGLDIQRTPLGTRVNIVAERPGMVIGRKGATINELTQRLHNQFGLENPQISVEEPAYNPGLNAQIMAYKMAESLERGWHFRRVGHSTVQRVMASGAQGVIVEIAGKLSGAKRRREKFIAGHVKYAGETAYTLMDHGYAQCKRKLGIIGCTVKIMKKDAHLPDEVKIFGPGEKDAAMQAQKMRQQQQAAGVQTAPAAPPAEGAAPAAPAAAPAAPAAPSEGRRVPESTGPVAPVGAGERRRERKSFTVDGGKA